MEQTKEEVVANLYALRAGLSIASSISNKTQEVKKRIDEINQQEIPNIGNEIRNVVERNSQAEKEKADRVDMCSSELTKRKLNIEELKRTEGSLSLTIKDLVKCLVVSAAFLLGFIIPAILGSVLSGGDSDSDLYNILMEVSIFLLLGFIISIGIFIKNYGYWTGAIQRRKEIRTYDLKNEEHCLSIAKEDREIAIAQQAKVKRENEQRYIEAKKGGEEKRKALENERLDCEATVMIEQEKFSSVYTSLQNEFSSFLDERDWGNVDLIIFNYETGRALDLRDALLQVDNERRNERLVSAVREATRSISNSIARGFGSLQQTMSEKLSALDRNISRSMQSIGGNLSKMVEQNQAVEQKLGQISSISSAQVALQQKMNTSSDEMANDIRYMKELSHRTYYGT